MEACISTPNVFSDENAWRTISYKVNGMEVDDENIEAIHEVDKGGYIVKEWTQSIDFPAFLSDKSNHKLECFNQDPGLYAFVMDRDINHLEDESETSPRTAKVSETIVPIGLAYLDCSTLQVQKKCIVSRSQVSRGVSLSVELKQREPFFTEEESLKFEPFVINIDTLNDYPIRSDEHQNDALEACYIYGTIQIDSNVSRKILASPFMVDGTNSSKFENSDLLSNNESKDAQMDKIDTLNFLRVHNVGDRGYIRKGIPVQFRSCILPALWDERAFRELITGTTYQLKVFDENIFSRLITPKILETYNNMLPWNNGNLEGTGQSVSTGAEGKGRGKGPDPTHEIGVPNYFLPNGHPIHESDLYLIDRLWEVLEVGSKILRHGTARFRMEQMLSSAEDLLMDFARQRNPSEDKNFVVIRDDITAEVRLEKPSCPVRWKIPLNMSLRGALGKCSPENNGAGSSNDKEIINKKREWRHERFHQYTTHLALAVEYRRALGHPEVAPSVLGFYTLQGKRDADGAFLQTTTRTGLASTLLQTNTLRQTFNYIDESIVKKEKSKGVVEPTKEVQQRLQWTPFNRMVFLFRYDDDETLETISNAVSKVNLIALSGIQGTLRSYNFTPEEMSAAVNGDLDVICGFSLIDDSSRIIVIEGLAGPDKGMQKIYLSFPRLQPNSRSLKILCNPEVLFSERLYTSFGPDIKRIRIRDNLQKLAQKPEIYDRNQVSESCFEAIDKVMSLKSSSDLKTTRDMALFPQVNGLNELELLYGEAVSRIDLNGTLSENMRCGGTRSNSKVAAGTSKIIRTDTAVVSMPESEKMRKKTNDNPPSSCGKSRRYPLTEYWNKNFEDHLQSRLKHRHNFIMENALTRKRAIEQAAISRHLRDEEDKKVVQKIFGLEAVRDGKAKIHCMSNHSMNFKTLAQDNLKESFRGVKDITFTYSRDFVSQTICLGKDLSQSASYEEGKRFWLTPSGFMVNKPRTKKELLQHPKRPSEGRIEDLHIPFEEQGKDNRSNLLESSEENDSEKGFKTRFEVIKFFGMNNPIKFQRNIDVRKIGDNKKLPRGKSTGGGYGDVDKEYWRSIFNGGEAAVAKQKQEAAEEREKWREKVIVDSPSVKVSGFKIRDKSIPADRTKDILRDTPRRQWLKKLRDRKSITGKIDLSYQEAPFTAMNIGEWVPNASKNVMLRISDKSKFMTTADHKNGVNISPSARKAGKLGSQMGSEQDFVRFIDSKALMPRSKTIVVKKKVPLFSSDGITGSHDFIGDPRWRRPQT